MISKIATPASIILLFIASLSLLALYRQGQVLGQMDRDLRVSDSLMVECYNEASFWYKMYRKEKSRN